MGAILENDSSQNWYHETLNNAAHWLKENNPFFKPYRNVILHTNQMVHELFFQQQEFLIQLIYKLLLLQIIL